MRNFMFCDCESQIPLSDPELQFMQTWKLTFANLQVSFGSGVRTPPVSDILCYAGMTPQQSTQNGNEEGHCVHAMHDTSLLRNPR